MAIVELQFTEAAFANFVRNQINRRRLPGRSLDSIPELRGKLLQRIECVAAQVVGSGNESPETSVLLDLGFHYNHDLAEVRAAGSLIAPTTHVHRQTLQIDFAVVISDDPADPARKLVALRWTMAGQSDVVDLDLGDDLTPVQGAIIARDSVVAIRLSTNTGDAMLAPLINRLEADEWALLLSGQLIADTIAVEFSATINEQLSDDVLLDTPVAASWFAAYDTQAPFAGATATLAAVVASNEIPIDFQLIADFEALGPSFRQTLKLSWDADTTVYEVLVALLATPIASAVVADVADGMASQRILGKAKPIDGFTEIARDEESITYQRTTILGSGPTPQFVLDRSAVTDEGLLTSGHFALQSDRRTLTGEVSPPRSRLATDCTRRRVDVRFDQPTVHLRDHGLDGGAPRIFAIGGVNFDPPDCWSAQPTASQSFRDLAVTFADPAGGRFPAGTATSVFLHTDCGLRWIDLGTIPSDHPPPTRSDVAGMISRCMALSDPWGMGVLNLDWLIDPPDLGRDIDVVRHWTVALSEELAGRFEILAVDGDVERPVGTVEGGPGATIDVITGASETLRIRPPRDYSGPPPGIWQRWIAPVASTPLDSAVSLLASAHRQIAVRLEDGSTFVVASGEEGAAELRDLSQSGGRGSAGALSTALDRRAGLNEGNRLASPIVRADRNTVAFVHRGRLVIGRPLERVRL